MSTIASQPRDVSQLREDNRVTQALNALPKPIRQLNKLYLEGITARSLLPATDCQEWIGKTASVFLRHDKVCVFAIVCEEQVGMADFVTLTHAQFHVDLTGRRQSNREQGPLPNRRSVHAYLTGTLTVISDTGTMPDGSKWKPIQYLPTEHSSFHIAGDDVAIHRCSVVRMTPGKQKVWALNSSNDRTDRPIEIDCP